jgi:hypothetical protein
MAEISLVVAADTGWPVAVPHVLEDGKLEAGHMGSFGMALATAGLSSCVLMQDVAWPQLADPRRRPL